ncbi:MAG: transposase [Patescibacteria group bacterium]
MHIEPEQRSKSRRSIRLRGYDYAESGWYFVTLCTQDRNPIFGRIERNGKMILSRYGHIAKHVWRRGKHIWKNVHLDAFIIMPDHIHAIISIVAPVGATPRVALTTLTPRVIRTNPPIPDDITDVANDIPPIHHIIDTMQRGGVATQGVAPTQTARPNGPACQSVGAFFGSYKSVVSKIFHRMKNNAYPIWQRNYYERIIRNENELNNVREYIRMNPVRATRGVAPTPPPENCTHPHL